MKIKKNYHGFAALEAIIVVIVLGIIGTIAWLFIHSTGDPTVYTTPDKKYSIRLADGWTVSQVTKEGELVAANDQLAAKPGKPATVEQHIDQFMPGFALVMQFGEDGGHGDAVAQAALQTKQGNKIEVFRHIDESESKASIAAETDYYYRIRSNGKIMTASYTFSGTETDRHTQVQAVLETVQFN